MLSEINKMKAMMVNHDDDDDDDENTAAATTTIVIRLLQRTAEKQQSCSSASMSPRREKAVSLQYAVTMITEYSTLLCTEYIYLSHSYSI